MNIVVLQGRFAKAPELRSGETPVARFTIAVDRRKKGEADFISCVAFGKTAENIEKYFGKGSRICVEGRIQTGSYEKDGHKVYTTDVIVEAFDFIDSKGDSKKEVEIPESEWGSLDDESFPFN